MARLLDGWLRGATAVCGVFPSAERMPDGLLHGKSGASKRASGEAAQEPAQVIWAKSWRNRRKSPMPDGGPHVPMCSQRDGAEKGVSCGDGSLGGSKRRHVLASSSVPFSKIYIDGTHRRNVAFRETQASSSGRDRRNKTSHRSKTISTLKNMAQPRDSLLHPLPTTVHS